ncbi:hypothetical protein VNO77_25967 [Canavalia gladiata]|uniref:Uncharacterized protein n=1 Tax=Canavalia gladiata TaxID=3824 RepID=A0AAN9Q5X4_CANGL
MGSNIIHKRYYFFESLGKQQPCQNSQPVRKLLRLLFKALQSRITSSSSKSSSKVKFLLSKIASTSQVPGNRPDNIKITLATKRQTLESSTGSPKMSSPKILVSLSREYMFKGLDKGKVKPGPQIPICNHIGSNDIELAHSLSARARNQTSGSTSLKSDSFNNFYSKPRVKHIDEVVPFNSSVITTDAQFRRVKASKMQVASHMQSLESSVYQSVQDTDHQNPCHPGEQQKNLCQKTAAFGASIGSLTVLEISPSEIPNSTALENLLTTVGDCIAT